MTAVPRYDDLPVLDNGLPHSWDCFAADPGLGTAAWLTPERVARAAREEVRSGERVNVSLPLDEPSPPFFGRGAPRHSVSEPVPNVFDDVVDNLYLQGSTQWDALRHRRDAAHGFFGGSATGAADGSHLGIDRWATGGLIGRCVLVDVARHLSSQGDYRATDPVVIGADMLAETVAVQGTDRQDGDILLVRTGFVEEFLEAGAQRRHEIRALGSSAGLGAGADVAAHLWDTRCSAIAVDNPGVEVLPRNDSEPYLHARLIPMLGMPMGEFFSFGELAAASAADGRYSGFFVSVPLNLPGGVGSPANAVVLR